MKNNLNRVFDSNISKLKNFNNKILSNDFKYGNILIIFSFAFFVITMLLICLILFIKFKNSSKFEEEFEEEFDEDFGEDFIENEIYADDKDFEQT